MANKEAAQTQPQPEPQPQPRPDDPNRPNDPNRPRDDMNDAARAELDRQKQTQPKAS